jgi:CRISPR-associated endonuclease Csn1
MKRILGLDLGTNSIGWALIEKSEDNTGRIIGVGSRIIPMSQDIISEFGVGNSISNTAERTRYRSVRRLREREVLRRTRLLKVLKILGFIREDFSPESAKIAYNTDNKFQFETSYNEMVALFKEKHPLIKIVPKDWTIYYLRTKALHQKISKEELAWIILQFNQKRGYFELRMLEEEEKPLTNYTKEFVSAQIIDIVDTGEKIKDKTRYVIEFDNGLEGDYGSYKKPDWIGQKKDFIVKTTTLKDSSQKVELTFPSEDDWTLRKKKTESEIAAKRKTVGEYILDILLENPSAKIRGKEVHTIERKFYKEEITAILAAQMQHHNELANTDKLEECIQSLYSKNEAHASALRNKSINHLIVYDILFYQRPLKSKKSLIDGCKHEKRCYKKDGVVVQQSISVAAKSHPRVVEFRLWQFIHNLRIIRREQQVGDRLLFDVDVTDSLLNNEVKYILFEDFYNRKSISQKQLLKQLKIGEDQYRWNYQEDKEIECNPHRAKIAKILRSNAMPDVDLFMKQQEEQLWHLLYSVHEKEGLRNGMQRLGINEPSIELLCQYPQIKTEYSAYSLKAINKLLPLLRCGKCWLPDRIEKTAGSLFLFRGSNEFASYPEKVKIALSGFEALEDFQGLPIWLAEYIIYNRHSERDVTEKIEHATDISLLKQHELKNPIVEQITNETLRLTQDVWKEYGNEAEPFFDEIHIELSREVKKTAKERAAQTKQINADEEWNKRAKALLTEFATDPEIEGDINPNSPNQIELFKLWEESRDQNKKEMNEELKSLFKKPTEPTKAEVERYKLWTEQKHFSPYTGRAIPLSKLFTREYDIEHIYPKARYFDDSFNNKVVAERSVNADKGSMTAYEYILKKGGSVVTLGYGHTTTILSKDRYDDFVKRLFFTNRSKLRKLLSEEIPDGFINRQLNDTRYISKKITELLTPVAKNRLVLTNGTLTSKLKNEWGLNDIMKDLMDWRFQRLNKETSSDSFVFNQDGKTVYNGYSKRLDHRHHALDALVVACTTQSHIQYVNTLNAQYRDEDTKAKFAHLVYKGVSAKKFALPWLHFVRDAKHTLQVTTVSFKNRTRILSKGSNSYTIWGEENGTKKRVVKRQDTTNLWSVRQPLHKETVNGRITLREYKELPLSSVLENWKTIADKSIRKEIGGIFKLYDNDIKKVKKHLKENPTMRNGVEVKRVTVYYFNDSLSASRTNLSEKFTREYIDSNVADSLVRDKLKKHLDTNNGDATKAFSAEGVESLNKTLDIPIYKVRTYENLGKKFAQGETGAKRNKYVEAAKGTNLFFVIYVNEKTGERVINESSSLGFKDVLELKKHRLPIAESRDGYRWFTLSPNDLVYVPEEGEEVSHIDWPNLTRDQVNRIYKMVSCTKQQCFFKPASVATSIEIGNTTKIAEFTSLDKMERAVDGQMVKQVCVKLQVDRLGRVSLAPYDSVVFEKTTSL